MGKKISTILLSMILPVLCAFGQDTQVTASASSNSVGVQDQFQLSITVSGSDSGDAEAPRLEGLHDFEVVSGPNVSTQFQWINGRTSSSKSFNYILIPEKEGQFVIDPVEVKVGGKMYRTEPVQIRVTSAPRNPQPPQRQFPSSPFDPFGDEDMQSRKPVGDAVMVRAELDRNSAYPGQQVTLFYRLYTQVRITGIQLKESPSLSGFWVENLKVDANPQPTGKVVDGREYMVYTIKKQALFPNASGRLRIPSSTFALSTPSSSGFFGIFDNTETLYRKTPALSLEVKPLPEKGRPSNFSNAVGSFNLTAGINRKQAAAGEAVELRVKLKGRGNLKMIPDIKLPSLPDFTIYSSKRADNIHPLVRDQIGGDKTWDYIIVPKAPGRQSIPSLDFSYFNAEKGKYESVSTPAMTLDVKPGRESLSPVAGLSGVNKQDLTRRGSDINFIKLSPAEFEAGHKPFYRNSWIYMILLLPLLVNSGTFLYQRRRSRLFENTALVRSRKARRIALNRLKAAGKDGRPAPRIFYDRAASSLTGYLADRFGMAEIELTEDNLARTLSKNSVPSELIEETKACLRECDFGRFVSATQSSEKMQALSERIRRNIDALEKASLSVNSHSPGVYS